MEGRLSAVGHQNSFTRVYSTTNGAGRNNGSPKPPLFRSPTSYYDILGVPGSATQSQIKTAYYRQSFRYHPDRNNGDEAAAQRFTEISEAYLILGSVTLRKKYDRGILSQEDVRAAEKPKGKLDGSPTPKRTESTSSSRLTPTKPIFDFDEFYRAHCGEQLERERHMKRKREELQRQKKTRKDVK
ncbi:dnaJ homolog subfamily C member 30, mitochondrial-like [Lissotriton helveticus]